MRSGHRSAHVKVVAASAVLAAAALACGWSSRAARPVPEQLSIVQAGATEAQWEVETATHGGEGS